MQEATQRQAAEWQAMWTRWAQVRRWPKLSHAARVTWLWLWWDCAGSTGELVQFRVKDLMASLDRNRQGALDAIRSLLAAGLAEDHSPADVSHAGRHGPVWELWLPDPLDVLRARGPQSDGQGELFETAADHSRPETRQEMRLKLGAKLGALPPVKGGVGGGLRFLETTSLDLEVTSKDDLEKTSKDLETSSQDSVRRSLKTPAVGSRVGSSDPTLEVTSRESAADPTLETTSRESAAPSNKSDEPIRKPTAGVFKSLLTEDLQDPSRLKAWYDRATTCQRSPVIVPCEVNLLRVFSCAERAVEHGRNPVALFAYLISHAEWDFITNAHEDRARERLRSLERQGSLFGADVGRNPLEEGED